MLARRQFVARKYLFVAARTLAWRVQRNALPLNVHSLLMRSMDTSCKRLEERTSVANKVDLKRTFTGKYQRVCRYAITAFTSSELTLCSKGGMIPLPCKITLRTSASVAGAPLGSADL